MRPVEIARRLNVPDQEMDAYMDLVRDLQVKGLLVEAKKNRLCLPKYVDLVVGTFELNARGFGFVIPNIDEGKGDIYIGEDDQGTAFHGDTVVARLSSRGGRRAPTTGRQGTIIRVLKRSRSAIVGTFQHGPRFSYCMPDDPRLPQTVYIAEPDSREARHGDKVVVRLFDWTDSRLHPEGEVTEVLGRADDPRIDAISVIRHFNLPDSFSRASIAEADAFGDSLTEQDLEGRLDLRSKTVITIDPESAHDFDDAVSLERLRNGHWQLGVHIADVAHYVRQGSTLDKEAQTRGTSVYLPGTVLPMLPPRVSSQLCTLQEGADRLTKTVLMEFGPHGKLMDFEVRQSVIRSARRMTYDQVTDILESPGDDEPDEIAALLREMERLAGLLHEGRMARGALELEIPEIEVVLDENGLAVEIRKRERQVSHQLIEEFMLAANSAVAHYCRQHNLPCMFRVHDDPSEVEIDEFLDFLLAWGYSMPRQPTRKDFQAFLAKIEGRPEAYPINLELLKSMKRAEYTPHHLPHYALAIDRYCHFTSPIRRYPDLLVHRILDEHFDGRLRTEQERDSWQTALEEVSGHCTFTERRADEAERELTDMKLLRHLERHKNLVYRAIIVRMRHFGFFVELEDSLVQGLVHVSRLTDDFYVFDEEQQRFRGRRNRRVHKLGDRIEIVVDKVDRLKRQVDFVPARAQ
jgi:ribonuclease R